MEDGCDVGQLWLMAAARHDDHGHVGVRDDPSLHHIPARAVWQSVVEREAVERLNRVDAGKRFSYRPRDLVTHSWGQQALEGFDHERLVVDDKGSSFRSHSKAS